MWNDADDDMIRLLDSRQIRAERYPRRCPVCQRKSAHVYLHRFDGRHLGSGWAWCSHHQGYAHVSCTIPAWWQNLAEIDESRLTHSPDYLENLKESVDNHVNTFTTAEIN